MREINFRAWEKTLKEIIPVNNIDFQARQINVNSAWRTFDEVVIMQFTGLKDKNGNEIYEGDIAKTSLGTIFVVEWDEDNCRFLGFTREELIVYVDRRPLVEVIGNIHQNPELLKN